jgi:adenylate cyclase
MVQGRPARVERRLSAILAADVAGYSRLMHNDEEATHAKLTALLASGITPAIAEHGGRIVKNTGDGFLAEFPSAVEAVRAAMQFQSRIKELTIGEAEDRRIAFRVGINIGDVIAEPHDIFGDGVNIAARLESIAEPGGICVSSSAYDQVRDKVGVEFADLGEQTVKNISRPVRVFALSSSAIAALPAASPTADSSRSPWYQSRGVWLVPAIAAVVIVAIGLWFAIESGRAPQMSAAAPRFSMIVLPFANLSGDSAQDYLPDVVTEGLTTALSRIKGAFVIARSTAFTYKGKSVDVRKVGKDLDVRYALEGSTQYSGGKVRVNAQLIDAETGAHLWADQFDADRADLFDMQDEIVTRLSRALSIQLVDVDIARVKRTRSGNMDAQDLAMQCLSGVTRSGPDDAAAKGLCNRALQTDSGNALALSLTAIMTVFPVITAQNNDPAAATKLADELASRALTIDSNFYAAHSAKAWVLMAKGRHEEAIVEAERCLTLNPSAIDGYLVLGIANNFLARPDRSLEVADKAIRLSPRDPFLPGFYEIKGEAYFIKRQDDNAIEWLRRQIAAAPRGDPYGLALFASALALTGQVAEARDALVQYLSNNNTQSKTIAQFRAQQLSLANSPKWLAYNERIFEGLRIAGMAEE